MKVYTKCPECGAAIRPTGYHMMCRSKYLGNWDNKKYKNGYCEWISEKMSSKAIAISWMYCVAKELNIPIEIVNKAEEGAISYWNEHGAREAGAIAIACLYHISNSGMKACNSQATFRNISKLRVKEMNKAVKLVKRAMPTDQACDVGYVDSYCMKLKLSEKVRLKARLYAKLGMHKLNQSPHITCAGAIYLASWSVWEPITQKKVAKAAGITEVSIRTSYRKLNQILKDGGIADVITTIEVSREQWRIEGKINTRKRRIEEARIGLKELNDDWKEIELEEKLEQAQNELGELEKELSKVRR